MFHDINSEFLSDSAVNILKNNNSMDNKVESREKPYKLKLQDIKVRNKVFQKKKITVKDTLKVLSLKACC